MQGFPWDDLRKIFTEGSQMAKVPNGVEPLRQISIAWVGCTNVTDDRQTTDGRTTTYSEHEHEFTFAKNKTNNDPNPNTNPNPKHTSSLAKGDVSSERQASSYKMLYYWWSGERCVGQTKMTSCLLLSFPLNIFSRQLNRLKLTLA